MSLEKALFEMQVATTDKIVPRVEEKKRKTEVYICSMFILL